MPVENGITGAMSAASTGDQSTRVALRVTEGPQLHSFSRAGARRTTVNRYRRWMGRALDEEGTAPAKVWWQEGTIQYPEYRE